MNELQTGKGGDRRQKTVVPNSTLRAIYWIMMLILVTLTYVAWTVHELDSRPGEFPSKGGPAAMDFYPG